MAVITIDTELLSQELVADVLDAIKTNDASKLVAQFNEEQKAYEDLQAKVQEKRTEVTNLRRLIRSIDPEAVPAFHKSQNGKKPGAKSQSSMVGPKKLEDITLWLQEHRDDLNAGEGFRPVELFNREDFPKITAHESTLSKALNTLHKQGILTLNKWVRGVSYPHRPTGKFYKVV